MPSATPAERPLVVACSGFLGMRNIHPARLARALTVRGYPVFGFDYRGFEPSAGHAGRVILDEQIRDIAAAVRAAGRIFPDRRLVLVGWGLGGGLVLEATRRCPDVVGIACLNGLFDAMAAQRQVRGADGWQEFSRQLHQMQSAATAREELIWVDPFFIYPLDAVTKRYVDDVLRRDPAFAPQVWLPFADSLLAFSVEGHLSELRSKPLLVVHGRDNALHPPAQAEGLVAAYPGPSQMVCLDGAGHTEWMLDEHPIFHRMIDALDDWLRAL